MNLSSCGKTHVGMKRSHNEDCLRVFRDENLYVVADGMGGHASGEVASEMSADTIAAFFRATSLDEDITWPYKYDYNQSYQENRIRVGVQMSNQRIFQSSVYDMKLKGMGTTMVAIYFYEDHYSVGHVGDSRVYLVRKGEMEQITEDHSLLNDYIKLRPEGMTQEEIDAFPHKNVIVRALGMKDQVEVDVITRELLEGDILLLCSDGLSGMLTDEEMLTLINRATRDADSDILNVDLEKVCDQLIRAANQNGGNDNITVLLVRCEPATQSIGAESTAALSSYSGSESQPVTAEIREEAIKNPFEPAWNNEPSTPSQAFVVINQTNDQVEESEDNLDSPQFSSNNPFQEGISSAKADVQTQPESGHVPAKTVDPDVEITQEINKDFIEEDHSEVDIDLLDQTNSELDHEPDQNDHNPDQSFAMVPSLEHTQEIIQQPLLDKLEGPETIVIHGPPQSVQDDLNISHKEDSSPDDLEQTQPFHVTSQDQSVSMVVDASNPEVDRVSVQTEIETVDLNSTSEFLSPVGSEPEFSMPDEPEEEPEGEATIRILPSNIDSFLNSDKDSTSTEQTIDEDFQDFNQLKKD